ncbi:MAG TPA: APC family permease [Candidatus Polarisedimenticolia bacterium]|jgi:amino acid transporter|nr:APC family permease [Candidatus Polarisedimenticolia bacterium]
MPPTDAKDATPELRRAMGFGDVVLYLITTGINLQWVATAAAAGPSSIAIWVLAFLVMAVPLSLSVVELSSRYPQEGGMYVWSKHAFGDFAAFMTGWTYWMSNLPYFPGVLYFAAGNALYIAGDRLRALSGSSAYFIIAALLGLGLGLVPNFYGLQFGKWLSNIGAVARWLAMAALLIIGGLAWFRFGPATGFTLSTMTPGLDIRSLIFWSTIAFALTGAESASLMGGEIKDARRSIPRAIFTAVPIVTLTYILGTASVLVALPTDQVRGLQGPIEAVDAAARRLGLPGFTSIAALLFTVSALGSVGAWLAGVTRLPFVAGIDRYLPRSFGRLHPRWRTPHVSLITLGVALVVCIVLGQAGTSVKGAYDVLVSMTVITTLIPFLLVFASLVKLQREPAGPGVIRVPGGRPVAVLVGAIGFATTAASIVLSFFPAPDEPHKALAVAKIAGLTLLSTGSGMAVYAWGRWRQRRG